MLISEYSLDYSGAVFENADDEKKRLKAAIDEFCSRTKSLYAEMKDKIPENEAEIISGHIEMINDPFMLSQMNEQIEAGAVAEKALDNVCNMFIEIFSSADDELTNQRATDVKDIKLQVLKILLGIDEPDIRNLPPDTVLAAKDLTPSMTAQIDTKNVTAVITQIGGKTSHSAILARALEIPCVLGIDNIEGILSNGTNVIVDGFDGIIIVSPSSETLAEYNGKKENYIKEKRLLREFFGKKTVMQDGARYKIYANIGRPADIKSVLANDGEGIGLFRTEFLFMDKDKTPSENEQFSAYKSVAEAAGGREVIIRTLDVGGDKNIPYLKIDKEDNPFLGYRAIRYCLDNTELFSSQLRAILRASAHGKVKILLPMITAMDELRAAKNLITKLKNELDSKGLEYDKNIKVGVMIETPSAVMISDMLARECDFFSIGTNDLTQYIMAVDRGNSKVSSLYSAYNPSVIKAIKYIVFNAKKAKIPVGVCGEIASDSLFSPLLLSFGIDEFSVSPAAVLKLRRNIFLWSKDEADRITGEILELSSMGGIEAYLKANAKNIGG